MKADMKKTVQHQILPTDGMESVPGRTLPQEEISHPNPDAERLLQNVREESFNTAGKGGNLGPSLGAEKDRREVVPNPAVKRKTPPSSDSEPEFNPDPDPNSSHWSYFQVIFDPQRRGNGCSVSEDNLGVHNSQEMDDCPDINRKAGTWGLECLNMNRRDPSQYWYLSIWVLSRSQGFAGPVCEVGVGTEYALCIADWDSAGAQDRYIKSTIFFNYSKLLELATANDNYQETVQHNAPLRVDLGIYWNVGRRRVHVLHLGQTRTQLLYSDVVSDEMDVWPVVGVIPFMPYAIEVIIRSLDSGDCPFAPVIDRRDLQAIIDAP